MNETKALFNDTVAAAAGRILEVLRAGGDVTSWDLKLKLHLSSSSLYLALGWLAAEGKIQLYPQELNYKVKITPGA